MATRSVWKGAITFGMVTIPAKLYTAAEDKRVSFHLMHRECPSRIQLPKWCPTCERKLEAAEIQRVYEVSKGQYVPMEESDFASLPLVTLKTIKVVAFIDPAQMDPRVFDKSYFLAPDELGVPAYALLVKAMNHTGLAAVAKLAYREREHLSLIRPREQLLLLQTLFYADELREPPTMPHAQPMLAEQDFQMALVLVNALKRTFDLSNYRDEYREALYRVIEAKMQGKTIAAVETPRPTTGSELSQSLKASIEAILAAKEQEVKI
jgi:DNA end-binding protein Ku